MVVKEKISKEEARFIIDNFDKMSQKEIAKALGRHQKTIHLFVARYNLKEMGPDYAYKKFLEQSKRYRLWTDEEIDLLIRNMNADSKILTKLFGRSIRSIKNKQDRLVEAAENGKLDEEKAKIVLEWHKKRRKKRRSFQSETIYQCPSEQIIPELKVGLEYKFRSGNAERKNLQGQVRKGKVISYYSKGKFYLVDFGLYRECISQADLLAQYIVAERALVS